MKRKLTALCALAFGSLAALISTPAAACTIELGSALYRISPIQNDGLSNAERVNCPKPGLLWGYTQATGWVEMRGLDGQQVRAVDIRGMAAGDVDFLVVVDETGRAAFRFGSVANGNLLANDDRHSTFEALDERNAPLNVAGVSDVSMRGGAIHVELFNASGLACSILSDQNWTFDWRNWRCGQG